MLEKIKNKLPVVLNQESYFFDIFENCLVLRYENETVREINEVILLDIERQRKEVWPNLNPKSKKVLYWFSKVGKILDYPEFNPHITFSKDFKGNPTEFPEFKNKIVLYAPNFKFKD